MAETNYPEPERFICAPVAPSRKTPVSPFIGTFVGLSIANLLCYLWGTASAETELDRTLFQAVAVGCCYFNFWLYNRRH